MKKHLAVYLGYYFCAGIFVAFYIVVNRFNFCIITIKQGLTVRRLRNMMTVYSFSYFLGNSKMSKKFINQLTVRLKARRQYLLREVKLRLKEVKNSGTDRLSDTADIASNMVDDEIVMSIAQGEAKEIEQIDNALKKIKKGKYGICENCGKSINKQRLMAIPFVNLCIKCKEDEERYEGSEIDRDGYRFDSIEYAGIEADDDKRGNMKHFDLNDINPYDN